MKFKFVDIIPNQLDEQVIYISLMYKTAVHLCVCGCNNEVVTPISPTDWSIRFDGDSISLDPSIGNWNFECKSHYWINNNEIVWCKDWNEDEIIEGRKGDKEAKKRYYKVFKKNKS